MRLTHLCDIIMAHDGPPTLVRSFGGEEGAVYGTGGGAVTGDRLRGAVRWTNHAHRRSDGVMLPDMQGVITTDEGAKVWFSMRGRTVWVTTPQGPLGNQMLLVLFEAEDERYRWLNDAVCMLEGTVDLQRPRPEGGTIPQHGGPARVYVCVNEQLEAGVHTSAPDERK